jgi:uncharacterized caspase-like protein
MSVRSGKALRSRRKAACPAHTVAVAWIVLIAVLVPTPRAMAESRALIVGINQYASLEQPLRGAVNDARRMRQFAMDELGFAAGQIRLLTDAQATDAAIIEQIGSWLGGAGAGDRALFYYSGHGLQLPDGDGDEADGYDEALVATNARIDESGIAYGFVTDDALQTAFASLPSRRLTVIVDSCHSGTMTRDALFSAGATVKGPGPLVSRLSVPRAADALVSHRSEEALLAATARMAVWSAVSAAQLAFEDAPTDGPPGGVFTTRFIEGLSTGVADANDNGVVSSAELLDYVSRQSERWCRNTAACTLGLTPTLEAPRALLIEPVAAPAPLPDAEPPALADVATDAFAHDNELDVSLELLPDTTVSVGDTVRFRVTSPRDGYLTLLDINAAGELVQLFPNDFADTAGKDNHIDAGVPLTIPDAYYGFELRANEPLGRGTLLAIVTEDDADLTDLLSQHRGIKVVGQPVEYLLDIAERLRKTWREDRFNRALRWSLAELKYEIAR